MLKISVLNVVIILCNFFIINTNGFLFLQQNLLNAMNQYVSEIKRFNSNFTLSNNDFYWTNDEEYAKYQELDYAYRDLQQPSISILDEKYDFIIVGSGPAGSVLANRLSENPKWKILLLEAGKRETFLHKIPLLAAYFSSTASNWGYFAEKNDGYCWGMDNGVCSMPRGKSLGGTSVINYMIYNRGNAQDFDRWHLAGNYGWSYEEVLPYFLKSEKANLRGKENSPYHNKNGLLSVEDVPFRSRLVNAFVTGSKEMGHKEVDYNSYEQLGVSYVQSNTIRGRRHSAAQAFLEPFLHVRPNLRILTASRATKILINPKTKQAYGIQFVNRKRTYYAYANKEVILSAGTFNSAQLLMLSGVGPANHLQKINVPLIHNLPVGKIMYDHMSHFGPTFIVNTTGESMSLKGLNVPEFKKYLNGKGKLTSIGGVEALNFIKTKNSYEPYDYPDAELIFVDGSFASEEGTGFRVLNNIKQSLYDQVYRPLETNPFDHWSVLVMHFHPKSRGYLELKDNNPFHWPKLYLNYFQNEDDVDTLLEGIKEAIRISQSPAMQKLGARLHDIPLPNCAHLHFGSDAYWKCSIRTLSCTLHHQVATCKMGPIDDRTAVVDPELRVYGITNLRVADCSIIPSPPTSHTNAISFMIGEKAADMIKRKWLQ